MYRILTLATLLMLVFVIIPTIHQPLYAQESPKVIRYNSEEQVEPFSDEFNSPTNILVIFEDLKEDKELFVAVNYVWNGSMATLLVIINRTKELPLENVVWIGIVDDLSLLDMPEIYDRVFYSSLTQGSTAVQLRGFEGPTRISLEIEGIAYLAMLRLDGDNRDIIYLTIVVNTRQYYRNDNIWVLVMSDTPYRFPEIDRDTKSTSWICLEDEENDMACYQTHERRVVQ